MRKLTLVGVLAIAATGLGAASAPAAKRIGKIFVNSGESIQCPTGGAVCMVSVRAAGRDRHNRELTLGYSTFTIAPAATAKLIFKLNNVGKHLLLTRGPLQAKLTITISDGSEAPIVSSHPITIGLPKKRHSPRR
ncbi:MAG TPA: hypothetical protein VGY76_08790 [Solirubrobacteraceae bacterium]|jgi:hypothetical protein|nr:hypothetical protein [Solirubrobacteraceae bacterium]